MTGDAIRSKSLQWKAVRLFSHRRRRKIPLEKKIKNQNICNVMPRKKLPVHCLSNKIMASATCILHLCFYAFHPVSIWFSMSPCTQAKMKTFYGQSHSTCQRTDHCKDVLIESGLLHLLLSSPLKKLFSSIFSPQCPSFNMFPFIFCNVPPLFVCSGSECWWIHFWSSILWGQIVRRLEQTFHFESRIN